LKNRLWIIIGFFLGISLLTIGFYFQDEAKTNNNNSRYDPRSTEYYLSVGTKFTVEEMLSDPNLIRIKDISDGRYVHLFPDGEGREYQCASLSIERLSQDEFTALLDRSKTTRFLNVTEIDLESVPQFRELIAATHQSTIPFNKSVTVYFDGVDFVEYEFFLADKMIEKYGGSRDDYFMRLSSDYEERLTNPKKQGFSNEFLTPQIIYKGNVYGISGTVFWTSDESNLRMTLHLLEDVDKERKSITLSDADMEKIPKFKESIDQIETKQESIHAFKSVPEHEQNYYQQWYEDKIFQQIGSEENGRNVSGFVYQGEYYSVGFAIC